MDKIHKKRLKPSNLEAAKYNRSTEAQSHYYCEGERGELPVVVPVYFWLDVNGRTHCVYIWPRPLAPPTPREQPRTLSLSRTEAGGGEETKTRATGNFRQQATSGNRQLQTTGNLRHTNINMQNNTNITMCLFKGTKRLHEGINMLFHVFSSDLQLLFSREDTDSVA